MAIELRWERIDDWHQRARVFGGWLVKAHEPVFHRPTSELQGGDGWDFRVAMTFVPDKFAHWAPDTKKPEETTA